MGFWFKGEGESSADGIFDDAGYDETITIDVPELEREVEFVAEAVNQRAGGDKEMSLTAARTRLRSQFANELSRQFERAGIPKEYQPKFIHAHSGLGAVSITVPRDPTVPVSPEKFQQALDEAIYSIPQIVDRESPKLYAQLVRTTDRSSDVPLDPGSGGKGPKKKSIEELAEEYAQQQELRVEQERRFYERRDPESQTSDFTVRALATAAFVAALAATAPGIALASASVAAMPSRAEAPPTPQRERDDELGL